MEWSSSTDEETTSTKMYIVYLKEEDAGEDLKFHDDMKERRLQIGDGMDRRLLL